MYYWAKYGTQTDIRFPMVKRGVADYAGTADWTPATGDTKVSKDGGSFANATNNPAAVAGTGSIGWKHTLTATELQCAELNLQIVDSATKAVEDQFITVYTYGHASAKVLADLSTAWLTAAQVNAEVVDALATDTYAEIGQGAPAATISITGMLRYLYKSWRNKKDNDGTTVKLYADDAATVDQKWAVSESSGTVTQGEVATGP